MSGRLRRRPAVSMLRGLALKVVVAPKVGLLSKSLFGVSFQSLIGQPQFLILFCGFYFGRFEGSPDGKENVRLRASLNKRFRGQDFTYC
jgi:hypothetical protein